MNRCHLKMTVCTTLSSIPERVHILSLNDDNPVLFFSNQVLVCIQREEDDIVKLEHGGF